MFINCVSADDAPAVEATPAMNGNTPSNTSAAPTPTAAAPVPPSGRSRVPPGGFSSGLW